MKLHTRDDADDKAGEVQASQIGSVDKALLTLMRLGEAGAAGRPLHRLAAELGLNKASLHHTLRALKHRGFVEQDGKGNYRLGPVALQLSDIYMRDESLAAIRDALGRFCLAINEICHIGVLAGEDIVYVHKTLPCDAMNTWSTVGFRNPALTTALGRAIVCHRFLDFDSFAAAFPTPLRRRTPQTRLALAEIWQELMDARRRGFARETDEYAVGTSCVAVALLRDHRPIAAISITGPTERLTDARGPQLVRTLRESLAPHLPPGVLLQAAGAAAISAGS